MKRKIHPDDTRAAAETEVQPNVFICKTVNGKRILTVGEPQHGDQGGSEADALALLNSEFKISSESVAACMTVYIVTSTGEGGEIYAIASRHDGLTCSDVLDLLGVRSEEPWTIRPIRVKSARPGSDTVRLHRRVNCTWDIYNRQPLRVHTRNTSQITLRPGDGVPIVHGEHPLVDFVSSFLTCRTSLPAEGPAEGLDKKDPTPRLWHVLHVPSGSAAVFTNPAVRMQEIIEKFALTLPLFRVTQQAIDSGNWPACSGWHDPGLTVAALSSEIIRATSVPSPIVDIVLSLIGTRTVDIEHLFSEDDRREYDDLVNVFGRVPDSRCDPGRVLQTMGICNAFGVIATKRVDMETTLGVISVMHANRVSKHLIMSIFYGLLELPPLEIYKRRHVFSDCTFAINGSSVDIGFALGVLSSAKPLRLK